MIETSPQHKLQNKRRTATENLLQRLRHLSLLGAMSGVHQRFLLNDRQTFRGEVPDATGLPRSLYDASTFKATKSKFRAELLSSDWLFL